MPHITESTLKPHITEAADFAGREWDVTILGPASPDHLVTVDGRDFVKSENGRLYAVEGLESSVGIWDGIKVYDNHLTQEQFEETQGMRSPAKEWLGTIVKPKWDKTTKKLKGIFKVVDESLAAKLKNAWDAGVLQSIGLSIDSFIVPGDTITFDGQQMPIVEGFKKALSVDLVGSPAAGGGFNRLIASKTIIEESEMDEEKVLALIEKALADKLPAIAAGAQEAQEPEQLTLPEVEEEEEAEEEAPEPVTSEQEARIARLEAELKLDRHIAEAKLPTKAAGLVRDMFTGRAYHEDEAKRIIKQVKEATAAADNTGRVTGNGAGRQTITVGMTEQDRHESEFLRLVMGNTEFRSLEHAKDDTVKERTTEAYHSWIKDGRPKYQVYSTSQWLREVVGGDPMTDSRASEAVTTSNVSSIVKNALNVMLANDYAKRQLWWEPIVRIEEVDTIQEATLVRTYGLDDLDVVTEGAAYTESTWADEEETAAFVKRGNFVGVTIEAMLRDNVGAIRTLPTRLATSWFNTLSSLVSGVFTVNTAAGPVLSDTGALFNATAVTTAGGHANLLTTAFGTTTAAYAAARLAMRSQTDKTLGTGNRIGILPRYILVPYDLEVAATAVINSENVPGSANNEPNPVFRESTVIGVPDWTDTDNWALVADPAMFPAIWLIFLTGNRVPSIFTADSDVAGAMFTNDTLRYKVRMMTYRFSATYDCAPVSDFRPLHKSNV